MKKILTFALALMMMSMCLVACSSNTKTYTASANGNNGPVTVSVSFDGEKITEVKVTDHKETKGLSDLPIEEIPATIVANNSVAVDVITGATNTSKAILEAVENCIEQAGFDVANYQNTVVSGPSEDIEETYDVVVLGGGGAGLTAAITAAQAGKSVILVEKAGALGGNSRIAGQGFNAADEAREANNGDMHESQKEELISYLDFRAEDFGDFAEVLTTVQEQIREFIASGRTTQFDSPELHMLHNYMGGKRTGLDGTVITPDLELTKTFANHALEALEWAETVGAKWADTTSTILGAMWPRSHMLADGGNIVDILQAAAEKEGVKIITNTAAKELIIENGEVKGAVCEHSNGKKVTLHSNNGVVLATGGYAANAKMVAQYNNYWAGLSDTMASTNAPTLVGDGIIMAQSAGADLVGMGFAQLMPSSHPVDGSLFTGIWGSAESQVFVNKEGKRYVNEYSERDVLSKAALEQTDGLFYIICDNKTIEATHADVAGMEAAGNVVSANTLEELATKLGIPADTFVAEIERYNMFVENQHDDDFGKSLFGEKIDVAPFVATPRSPSLHHTMGGVKIDSNAHVINTEGQIIKGLYAAGEVCGGIHAGNRLGGNAMTDFLVFGHIAGQSVAEAK